jgi:hypothetical protein
MLYVTIARDRSAGADVVAAAFSPSPRLPLFTGRNAQAAPERPSESFEQRFALIEKCLLGVLGIFALTELTRSGPARRNMRLAASDFSTMFNDCFSIWMASGLFDAISWAIAVGGREQLVAR